MRDLNASFPGEVMVELELFLKLQGLISAIGLATSSTLGRVGTWKMEEEENIQILNI